jgi:uncharacterized membrane protein
MMRQILQGRVGNHPIHPYLVHLPIGLFAGSLIFDIVYLIGRIPALITASYYCIKLGIVVAVVAAVFGAIDLTYVPRGTRARRIALNHMILNIVALAFFVVSYAVRLGMLPDFPVAGFVLSLIGMAIFGVSAYLGGVLVYEYGIGQQPEKRNPEQPDESFDEAA